MVEGQLGQTIDIHELQPEAFRQAIQGRQGVVGDRHRPSARVVILAGKGLELLEEDVVQARLVGEDPGDRRPRVGVFVGMHMASDQRQSSLERPPLHPVQHHAQPIVHQGEQGRLDDDVQACIRLGHGSSGFPMDDRSEIKMQVAICILHDARTAAMFEAWRSRRCGFDPFNTWPPA